MVSKVTFVAIAAVFAVVLCMVKAETAPTPAPTEAAAQAAPTSEGITETRKCQCCEGKCDAATATGCSNHVEPKCFKICQEQRLYNRLAVSPAQSRITPVNDDHLIVKCPPSPIGNCKHY